MPLMMKTEQVMSGDLEPPPHCQGIPPASMMGRSLSKIVCSLPLHYQTTLDMWGTVNPTHAVLDLVYTMWRGGHKRKTYFLIGNCWNDWVSLQDSNEKKPGMQCFLCMIFNFVLRDFWYHMHLNDQFIWNISLLLHEDPLKITNTKRKPP